MTKILKRPVSIILAALMIISLFAAVPITAQAASTELTAETTTWVNGDYVVPADGVTISGHITVKGIVNLTLTEGATLTANMGITLGQNARLNVSGKGAMVVNGSNGNTNSTVAGTGKLVLKSGTVTATGGNGQSFSSGVQQTGNTGGVAINGTVIVNGGTLAATGGNGGSLNAGTISQLNGGTGGAAIGGSVTINGGTVTATGGNGGSITITNYGDSNKGGNGGAAIGGVVTINGGTLTATKGDNGTLNIKNGSPNYAGTGSAGYDGTLTLGANVKLYEGTDNTGTVLDDNDSDSRVYSGEKKANMYAYGSDVDAVDDKSELNDAITVAEKWYGRIKNNTDYTDIASALKTAIDTAKAVADNDEAGQDVVDTATQNLITAILSAEASTSMGTTWEEETYVVPIFGETIAGHITVTGTVNLILTKGATLTANAGITLNDGATLNVSGDGAMVVNGTSGNTNSTVAGMGVLVLKSGTLTVNGGNGGNIGGDQMNVTANAGGAAINGNVVVNGGTLTATGGNGGSIGDYAISCTSGAGGVAVNGNVTVNGGTLTATDGAKGTGGRTARCTFGAGGAGYSGTLTLGKGVKLYEGTEANEEKLLDGNDSASRVYSSEKKASMYAYGPDISQGPDKTALNDAITAAETLYDSIKDDTDYSTIASTLKTAIDAAKEVADSETADQDAVDTANGAISDATTAAVVGMINALPSSTEVTTSDKDKIEAVRAAYDNLTDAQKESFDTDTLKKLTDAETTLQDAVDTEAAQGATNTINALPDADEVTTADKDAIEAARKAYNDLTDDQKKKVSDDTLKKLTDAEDALKAAGVSDTINALPAADEVTTADKDDIEAARKAYNDLTDDQKKKVSDDTLNKLTDAEDALKAAGVSDTINALPAADEVTTANKEAVAAARKAYDDLTDDQKSKVSAETLKKLTDAEKAIADLEAAESVTDSINDLPDTITLEDKADVEAARAAYDALTDEQKAQVEEETLKKLTDAEAVIADLVAAKAVSDEINDLPTAEDITLEDKADVEAARAAYDALTDDQKAKVSDETLAKLTAAEEKLAVLLAMSEVSAKTGKDATYNGKELPLVNAPTSELPQGCTMKYALGKDADTPPADDQFTADVPTAKDAGIYYVWYKAVGDESHPSTEPECKIVRLAKAVLTVTAKNQTVNYGSSVAQGKYTVKGLAEGDTVDVKLYGKIATNEVKSTVTASSNYTVKKVSGILTIKLSPIARAVPSGKNLTVKYTKVQNADGYDIYAGYCGTSSYPLAKSIKGNTVYSTTLTKIGGKAIDTKKNVFLYVVAYKNVNGKKVTLVRSASLHIAGANSTRTNVKSVKVAKTAISLKKGKTTTLKPTVTLVNNKKHAISCTNQVRYASCNKSIATVDANGKITAVAPGTVNIYAYASNGVRVKIVVTVK